MYSRKQSREERARRFSMYNAAGKFIGHCGHLGNAIRRASTVRDRKTGKRYWNDEGSGLYPIHEDRDTPTIRRIQLGIRRDRRA